MKQQNFLYRTDFPVCKWRKQIFIDRLHTSFSGLKELREYKEDESCGVIHIFIRVGLSAKGHLLGAVFTLGIANLAAEVNVGGSQSVHKYFSARTGEFLGHSVKDAAKALIRIGKTFYMQGSYSKAREYFENAYEYSEAIYLRDKCFQDWRDDATKFINKGLKSQAAQNVEGDSVHQKYKIKLQHKNGIQSQEPQDCAADGDNDHDQRFSINEECQQKNPQNTETTSNKDIKRADDSKNKEAETLYEKALACMCKGQHAAAKDFCTRALDKCSFNYQGRQMFEKKKIAACVKLQEAEDIRQQNDFAEGFYGSGMGCLWRKEYSNAIFNFEQAYIKCTSDYVNKTLFYEKQLEAEAGLRRQERERQMNEEAEVLCNQGASRLEWKDFAGAKQCFTQAYDKCSENYERKSFFSQQRENAEREMTSKLKISGWIQKPK